MRYYGYECPMSLFDMIVQYDILVPLIFPSRILPNKRLIGRPP